MNITRASKRIQYYQLFASLRRAAWYAKQEGVNALGEIIHYNRMCSVMHPSVVKAVEYAAAAKGDILGVQFRYRVTFERSGDGHRISTLYLKKMPCRPFVLISGTAREYPAVFYKNGKWRIVNSHGVPF
jgi:hypothetical protein